MRTFINDQPAPPASSKGFERMEDRLQIPSFKIHRQIEALQLTDYQHKTSKSPIPL
jgi:hypothetical protein